MLELYHHNISVCAQKVRLVLEEKGLKAVEHHIDLKARQQTSPEYLAINPRGTVPALVHGGRPILESTIICEYLDDAFPEAPVRPADPADRAEMRRWAKMPDDGIHVACGSLSFACVFADQVRGDTPIAEMRERLAALPDQNRARRQLEIMEHKFDSPIVQDAIRLHMKMLTEMSGRLQDNDWLAGDGWSLAEACLLPYVERLHRMGLAPMWADLPGIAAWYDRVRARPSYERGIAAYPPLDAYDDLLIERGETRWPEVQRVLAG
jgi:glutathione S-transferase